MNTWPQKKLGVQDALAYIIDGNDSDLEDFSSDDDDDADDNFVIESQAVGDSSEGESEDGSEPVQAAEASAAQGISGAAMNNGSPSKKHVYRWRHKDIPKINAPFHENKEEMQELKTPLEYFKFFWSDELIDLVVEQTNLYSTQKTGYSVNTNHDEIEQFLGMNIMMGIIQLPSYAMYWSQKMRYPPIADKMSLKRYEKLRRFLHFVDNSTFDQQTSGKLYKIQPILESVRQQCLKVPPEESHSVDEQIIPAKTRYSGIRQYNPKKPVKWGFKNHVRAGASGFMYDFYVYAGKEASMDTPEQYKHLQKSSQVVARLCTHLPKEKNHKLFFDNWFTSLDLLHYLKKNGILACGTVRANRLEGCPLSSNKDLKKGGRGSLDYRSDLNSGIIVTKWYDNNAVHLASNFVGVEPMSSMERWCPTEKERKEIECPQIVVCYNKGMGGVDLADMLISLYRIAIKTKRWYIKIFWHCVDIAKVNAWLLYRRHCDDHGIPKKRQMSLVKFITEIAEVLLSANKVAPASSAGKPGRPLKRKSLEAANETQNKGRKPKMPQPNEDLRFDQLGHWPEPERDRRGRCRHCKTGYSQVYCCKCGVCLCLRNGSNCFKDYHSR